MKYPTPLIFQNIFNSLTKFWQAVSIVDAEGEAIGVTDSALDISMSNNGIIDENNSTNIALDAGVSFAGDVTEVKDFGIIYITTKSDVASGVDGLSVQQSSDGINFDHSDEYTVNANTGKTFSFQAGARYFRIVYTNGAEDQSWFRLQTLFKKGNGKPSSHRIQDSINDEDDAELVKSILSAKFNGAGYGNITATASGNLRTTDAESGLAIAKGDVEGTTFIHKFGAAPDYDIADGFVTVWDGAEDNEPYEAMQYTYSVTDDIDYLSAQDNGDTQLVEVQGLDIDYNLVIQTKTLTGQTPVELDAHLLRIFRIKNIDSSDLANHIFCYVSAGTTVTAGVPQDGAKVRAVVHGANNQTEMAVFTIPAGKTGYMRDWYASTAGAKRDSSHTIRVLARPFGQVFQLKHTGNIDVTGTSYIKHNYIEPEVFSEKTDIEIRMNTNQNEAGVAAGFDIVLIDN